ncbi:MAG: hypothetical protein K9I85_03915 [Saprospiraceae bacterium]|nr:hypothetical protein [Saprospiraceae bacterium]
MRKWIYNFRHSFPIRLFLLHFQEHVFLLVIWVFLWLLMTGNILKLFGIKFLMLLPEYLDKTGNFSYAILGTAFGALVMTWNLVTYLMHASRFPFLAALSRPFTKFALNNSLIPLIYLILFFWSSASLQTIEAGFDPRQIIGHFLYFLFGMLILSMVIAIYLYLTNKDIHQMKPGEVPAHLLSGPRPGGRVLKSRLEERTTGNWGVELYLSERLRMRRVRSVAHYEPALLKGIYRQNHLNTLLLQVISLILLTLFGLLEEIPVFRIPAGASVYIMASMVLAVVGAISYWFGTWRLVLLVFLLILVNLVTGNRGLRVNNQAFGLDYSCEDRPTYNNATLDSLFNPNQQAKDKEHVQQILERWLQNQPHEKPKLVIICASGGGLKSAVWTMQVMSQLEQAIPDSFMQQVALMTGASGGIFGMAYQRELWLRQQQGFITDYTKPFYTERMAGDLLNSVAFSIATNDLFFPGLKFSRDSMIYRKDRGYSFEMQFHENTGYVLDKVVSDYEEPEKRADIPMLFISPTIVNDGRRLIISPQPVSFLCRSPLPEKYRNRTDIDGVDFGQMFRAVRADRLAFSSALRMNATYPYILPEVSLPSVPAVDIMDAGFRDNYGISLAARFLEVYKDWIYENTSGVVLLQVRSWDKKPEIKESERHGVIRNILNPLGIIGQQLRQQDFEHDAQIGFLFDLFGEDMFDIVRFVYKPGENQDPASMSFHLTQRERQDILGAWTLPHNQWALAKTRKLLGYGEMNLLPEK